MCKPGGGRHENSVGEVEIGCPGGSVGPVGAQEDSQKSQHVTSRDKRQGLLVGRESPEEKALEPESV